MHRQGIFIGGINAVVVTHNHLDQNADMGTISALQHDVNRYNDSQVRFYKKFFHEVKDIKHTISWWLDEDTQETAKGIVTESKELSQCSSDWMELNDKVSMMAVATEHIKEGKSYGLKYKIRLDKKQIIVGYTSDTRYFPALAEFMRECDILIFNISDIYEKDVRGTKSKSSHLGYDGSIQLLTEKDQKFSLAIASEFCCNNGDYRMSVARELNDHVKQKRQAHVIPGEIGLKVDLQSEGIYCSRCKRVVPLGAISIASSEREFGTQTRCREEREILLRKFIDELKAINSGIDYEEAVKNYYTALEQEDVQTPEMYLAVYPYPISIIREKEEKVGGS